MANTILHKRSSTPAGSPGTGQLALGEIAINTYDGKLFLKKDDGAETVVEIGADLGDLTVTSAPESDILASTKDLFQLTASSLLAFDVENVPDYGFDVTSITDTTNSAGFSPPASASNLGTAYFRPDGMAVYIVDTTADPGSIVEFLLGTAWDLSTKVGTANATKVMSSGDHANDMRGVWFDDTGTKVIVSGATDFAEYNIAIPWDIANAVFVQTIAALGTTSNASPLTFSQDGLRAYKSRRHSSLNQWYITEISVGTPWDLTSFALVSDTFEVTAETGANGMNGVSLNNDGTKVFIFKDNEAESTGTSKLLEYDLATPYLITSASYTAVTKVLTHSRYLQRPVWSQDGTHFYTIDTTTGTIYEYSSSAVNVGGLTTRLYHNGNERVASSSLGATINGSLAFTGAEAQVALPNFATASLPSTPIDGGMVYDTDTKEIKFYNGTSWTISNGLLVEDTNDNIVGGTGSGGGLTTGTDNFIAGVGSGNLITDGVNNKIIGNASGLLLASDTDVIILGDASWSNIGGHNDQVIIGNNIDIDATAVNSIRNVVIGNNIGGGTTTQFYSSTLIGHGIAAEPLGTGTVVNTVAIGVDAGLNADAMGSSVVIGNRAGMGDANTELSNVQQCVFVGYEAGSDVNAVTGSIGIGYAAVRGNSSPTATGGRNVGVGTGTMRDFTTGANNSALGYEALNDVSEGSENVGIGYWAGETITTGSSNICIGSRSGPAFGAGQTADSLLYVDITRRDDPLLGGDFVARTIDINGDLEVSGNVVSHIGITTETTIARTLALVDDGELIECTNATAITTITIPDNSVVAFPIGTQILLEQGDATFAVTVAMGGTDTLTSAGGLVSTASQYSLLTLIKKAATVWLLAGDLA